MKKIPILLIGVLLSFACLADEGMWLPININQTIYGQMKALGLQLTADEIYNPNGPSLKDAIVSLGGFCTGEIISRQGLLLTNHHCAESSIQAHSSVENDYLKNGFWAQTMEDELPNPELYARFLVRMEDVTKRVMSGIDNEMTEAQRRDAIDAQINEIVSQAANDNGYDAEVKPVFENNQYYLFIYETYRDVRLVAAPPTSIGFYGGETDNWTWPRHTGDFSLFRIYTGPDGKPAEFSPNNIPLKPKHHLKLSLQGYSEHDFAMILGFPGSTRRYVTSYALEMTVNQVNPELIKIMQTRQDILKEDMQDERVQIQYHSKFFVISNSLKYYQGQTKGIIEQNVIEKRRKLEDEFEKWVRQRKQREEAYGSVLQTINMAYDSIREYNSAFIYSRFTQYLIEIFSFAHSFAQVPSMLGNSAIGSGQMALALKEIEPMVDEFYDDYNPSTDQKVFAALFRLYKQNVKEELQPEFLKDIDDFDQWAEHVYSTSIFTDKERLNAFLADPESRNMENDTIYNIGKAFAQYSSFIRSKLTRPQAELDRGNRLFVKALMEMQPDKQFYPDANSTLRLTYGTIKGYSPADAVEYGYYTTSKGLLAKHQPGDEEFEVPKKLINLLESRDFGSYGQDKEMILNFTSDNDITGGNSGSPVLNARGELIGIAFDGNWEAMSSDIAYIPDLQRCISVDIRYVLFILEKFANANHLIDEMDIARETAPVKKRKAGKVRAER